ncbi:MAG: adenylosuccinate lyase [Chloroflexota bacterium]
MIDRYALPEMTRVWSEENRFQKWLDVEIAACEAWCRLGQVPPEAMASIRGATCNVARLKEIERKVKHELTAFLAAVAETLGEESRYIHFGLTSSDVMDTALSLQVKEATVILRQDIERLVEVLARQAIRHKYTVQMGRTHGVHAEPITFGFKLALWYDEMRRNLKRLDQAAEQMAVGKISGAVGTHANVPPEVEEYACQALGLRPAPVSTQVIQRDRHAHFITTLAVIAASLEKMATEIRALQKTEVLEVEEPFAAGQQGSSAMPHKRNPELCERVCGLARVIRGHAVTAMENVALWHERDISHSSTERIIFPEACGLLDYMLNIMTRVLDGLIVYPHHMKRNIDLSHGLVFSQRVLLALIEKGLSRQEAYEITQRNAMRAWREETSFLELLRQDDAVAERLSETELAALFDTDYHLRYIDTAFKRIGLEVTN